MTPRFQASGFQSYVCVWGAHLCCFKPPSSWYFLQQLQEMKFPVDPECSRCFGACLRAIGPRAATCPHGTSCHDPRP